MVGSDSHGTGAEGLQPLVDHFLSPDDPAGSSDDAELAGFTSDHDTRATLAKPRSSRSVGGG